jgi:predicted nucleic acid-binding protein
LSGFLLDTNAPSELIRTRPDPNVERWVYAQNEQSLYLSVVSIGELRRGTVVLPISKRRTELTLWLDGGLLPRFRRRILPITQPIADRWGVLDGQCQLRGTPLNTADGMIAATALEHGLTVVTRNVRDFVGLGVEVINPWNDPE